MHDDNCFITLTYDDDHLPWDKSLNKKHFQDFMKRLRFKERHKKLRYFHCGEYGDQLKRPHYHALIFGHDFEDKTLWTERDGIPTWTSEQLQNLWPFGFTTVGRLTFETAAYCARYTTKKRTGKEAQEHYWTMLDTDMEIEIQPEYATMSLKPAIGNTWFSEYKDDCFPSDFITQDGKKFRVPKYYDTLIDENELKMYKENRKRKAWERNEENTGKRLRQREICANARLETLTRLYET